MGNDNKELFEEAAKQAIEIGNSLPEETPSVPDTKKKELTNEEIMEAVAVLNESKQWELLAARMKGPLAKRFMDELDNMSGKEYVKNYLKMLEYVKPKITRTEITAGDEDSEVNLIVHVKKSRHNYEGFVKDIDHEEVKDEDE